MRVTDLLLPAVRQFRTQRLQALLIAVAIALGVGVVVAVAAQVQTAARLAASLQESLMARELSIRSTADGPRTFAAGERPAPVRRVGFAEDEPVAFTLRDLEEARQALPSAEYVYFEQFHGLSRGAEAGFAFVDARVVTSDYLRAARFELQSGSLFTAADYEGDGRVLLATPTFLREFELPAEAAAGSSVELDDATYRIAGVVAPPEPALGLEAMAYLPLTEALAGRIGGLEIKVAVDDPARLSAARAEVEAFASGRWGRRVYVEAGLPDPAGGNDALMLFVAGFASLGLLVAALNIMNLMLARVLRRQREIGVARSLGATRARVAQQVLAEALALGALGGLLGVAAGYGLLRAYDAYLHSLSRGFPSQAFTISLPWSAALLGVGIALLVSLLFGLYPAVVAARVEPVTALRRL